MAAAYPLSARLNRLWRLLATGLGFVFFGVFGVLLQIVLLPWLLRRSPDLAQQKQARRVVTRTWLWFSYYLMRSGILSAEFEGFDRLGRPGQLILANHPSLLDVVFLLGRVPEANCIVKADLQRNPQAGKSAPAATCPIRKIWILSMQCTKFYNSNACWYSPKARAPAGTAW